MHVRLGNCLTGLVRMLVVRIVHVPVLVEDRCVSVRVFVAFA